MLALIRRAALPLALSLSLAGVAQAQDARALAEQYAALPAVQSMMDAMFSPEAMMAQLAASLPPGMAVTPDQQERIAAAMSEGLGGLRPSVMAAMVDASEATFTPEELQAMVEFYGSDVGASILGKTQPMMAQVMAQVGPEMQAAQMELMPQVQAILGEGQ